MKKAKFIMLTEDQKTKYKNKMKKYFRAYRSRNKEKTNKISRLSRMKIKIECFQAYGGCFCCWCREKDVIVLTIDHINNDGANHRKKLWSYKGGGTRMYNWLKKNNYPVGYQVLCFNCNNAKERNKGILPNHRHNKYLN